MNKPKRSKFKRYPIGFFHIDIAEVQTAEGKLFLFVGIDRTSKFAVTQLVEKADRKTAWEFLQHMLEAVPYRVHTILTDNGIQFAEQPRNRNTAYSRQMRFDMICEANEIEHRLTKPNHPWTNGQVERMNRTIKEATVKRFHYENHGQLKTHLSDFMAAYNFARRLKTLSGLTPYEYICKIWTSEPDRFILNPIHQMPGTFRGWALLFHCTYYRNPCAGKLCQSGRSTYERGKGAFRVYRATAVENSVFHTHPDDAGRGIYVANQCYVPVKSTRSISSAYTSYSVVFIVVCRSLLLIILFFIYKLMSI